MVSLLFLALTGTFGSLGSLIVGAAVRRGSPRFGVVAAGIAFVGFAVAAQPRPVPAIVASADAGLSDQQLSTLVAGIDGQLQSVLLQSVLFPLMPAGLLLLGRKSSEG